MTRLFTLTCSLLVLLSVALLPASAQSCSESAAQALAQVGTTCGGLADNSACYGHNGVIASFSQPVSFDAPGSIAPLPPLQTVATLPYNAAIGEWGIAVLRLDANLPGMLPGQNTTLLLMGDAQLAAGGDPNAPMQAFTVRVGVGQPQCAGLPPSSITINGPQRANLDLTVNGASMRLGSSVTIRQVDNGQKLRFLVTAGRLTIEGGPVLPVGFAVSVAVDDDGEILFDSWEDVEPMTADELEELGALEDLPEDVLGEDFPLPDEDEIALLAALDFDMLLELDPYLAFALAENWATNGYFPEDMEGLSLDDLEAYVFDNLDIVHGDDGLLWALGDSFGLSDDDLFYLADELGIDFNPDDFSDPSVDDGSDANMDDADAEDASADDTFTPADDDSADDGQAGDDQPPPDDGGGGGGDNGGESGDDGGDGG